MTLGKVNNIIRDGDMEIWAIIMFYLVAFIEHVDYFVLFLIFIPV